MYKILVSNKYLKDVEEVFSYIAFSLYNIDAAHKLKEKFNTEIEKLKKYPFVNLPMITKQKYLYEYRKVKVGNYYIIYYVDNDTVRISRLVYSKRDFDNLII